MNHLSRLLAATMLAVPLACGNGTEPSATPPLPTSLYTAVTNPYFPLPQGTTWVSRTQTTAGVEIDSTTVAGTKAIHGFTATEVHDRVYLSDSLEEDTFDWFAQDSAGNVWYLGEDTKEYAHGQVVSTEGTWQWGVHGATPGIIMWGDTTAMVGKIYRQEFDRGNAQDVGKIVALNESVTVPFGTLSGCIKTEEWSTLESVPHENKYYCPQIGTALEVGGGGERSELISKSP